MSMLSEHQANGNATETRPPSADTAEQILAELEEFHILCSKADTYIFKYAYLYLLGFLLLTLLAIIFPPLSALKFTLLLPKATIPIISLELLAIVGACLILWTFNVWSEKVPQTLREIYEKNCIDMPTPDRTSQYLEFLKKYHCALRKPIKCLLSAVLMIVGAIYFSNEVWFIFYLLSNPAFGLNDFMRILVYLGLLALATVLIGFMYCLGIGFWSQSISGQYLRKMSQMFTFRIEPVHPDNCGGLSELGNLCFASASPICIGFAFYIGWILVAAPFYYLDQATIEVTLFILLLIALPCAIFAFFRPLWSIHTNMLGKRKKDEEHYVANIAPLREKIQVLLDANQLEEAKTMKEKKELMEALYIPYPTWPFTVKSKLFQTIIGASGSLLVGMLTALAQPLVQAILNHPKPLGQ